MPKVYSRYDHRSPRDAVFVGRPGPWGNPFTIGIHGTRAEVLEKYRDWLAAQPIEWLDNMVETLRGRDLICHCVPLACHGDILLELANAG